ncbi:MAG: methyltransferase domain-containing protein [Acidobacteriota bacterium]
MSRAPVEDVRSYYAKILPFYEKEAIARSHLVFWRGLARRWRPESILEVGCGIGRITAALSRLAPTVGIDVSLEMLDVAVASVAAGSAARFAAADMRRVAFGRPFDLIVAPSDPFSHLLSLADRRRALRAVAAQLAPAGRFVLEGLYRRDRQTELPPRRIRHPEGVLEIEEAWYPVGVRDLWHGRYRYSDRRPGERDRTLDAAFVARAWKIREISALFEECGLAVETLWGDFDGRPFSRDAARVVVVARRKRGLISPARDAVPGKRTAIRPRARSSSPRPPARSRR